MALAGWHRGERAMQARLGFDGPMSMAYTMVEAAMPHEHMVFHCTRLSFLPVTTIDRFGRPWSSIFAGSGGGQDFISSPRYDKLVMEISLWGGEPFVDNVELFGSKKMLVAGIGIEFSTRRRNKLAGYISKIISRGHNKFHVEVQVNQALGNCPKYINIRDLVSHRETCPSIAYRRLQLDEHDRLPTELIDFIINSDTVFIGSYYQASKQDEPWYPSHVGQNQRGGRQGFIRVRPTDGRTIVLPDYSGNRFMSSLGNIEVTPVASLTFVSFTTGDMLYITGDARTLVGPEARALMPRQNVLTTIYTTGFVFVRDALPVRQRPGTDVEPSPYSPPIRPLAEEMRMDHDTRFSDDVTVTLTSIELHSDGIATFTWEASQPITILPGQTAILDFTNLVGAQAYHHMAPWKPSSINDDRIRTWTVSSTHSNSPEGTRGFTLTMREKLGGSVTGALFTIARKLRSMKPDLLRDSSPLGLKVSLVGISGDFILPKTPSPDQQSEASTRLLWISGGIGVTPFLSMLRSIVSGKVDGDRPVYDVIFTLSTREPAVLVPLISRVLRPTLNGSVTPRVHLQLHTFSSKPIPALDFPQSRDNIHLKFIPHVGRLDEAFFGYLICEDPHLVKRTAYLCGPELFEKQMLDRLADVGLDRAAVRREGFEY